MKNAFLPSTAWLASLGIVLLGTGVPARAASDTTPGAASSPSDTKPRPPGGPQAFLLSGVMQNYSKKVSDKVNSMVSNVTERQKQAPAQDSAWTQKATQFKTEASNLKAKLTQLQSGSGNSPTLRQRIEADLAKLTSDY